MTRKRQRTPEEPTQEELPLTPMIDIIFQLVIFFMCAAHFKQIEGKLESYLPKDKGLRNMISELPPLPELRIRLVRREEIVTAYLEGRQLGQFPAQPDRLQGLSPAWDRIAQEAAPHYERNRREHDRAYLSIDADPQVPFQYVVSTLDACRRAGIEQIEFAGSAGIHESLNPQ
jgi:biopolymer transport protein ExbD